MSNKAVILGDCHYNPKTRIIKRSDGSTEKLSHIPADLLKLLYQNKHRYISTDELQKVVWDNKTIENRSIMRCVSTVRKALKESNEIQYIENRRNEGYRFTAEVKKLNKLNTLYLKLPVSLIFFSSLLIQTYQYYFKPALPNKPDTLTTMVGQEIDGAVGAGLLLLSHKKQEDKHWNIYGRKLDGERYFTFTSGEYTDRHTTFSPDGKKIAFHRYDGKKSMVMTAIVNPVSMELEKEQVVYYCLDELRGVSITWMDNDNLYLALTDSLLSPYQVHHYDLNTKVMTTITEKASGAGDYYVNYSKASKQLVYFRSVGNSMTEIWSYNATDKSSTYVTSVPLMLYALAWLNEGKDIVVRTGNGMLSMINLKDGEIHKDILNVNYPTRFLFTIDDNNVGYTSGHIRVADLLKVNIGSDDVQTIATSSFHDRLPSIATDTGDLVFVSTRSGKPQIWLLEQSGDLQQVTDFKKSYSIPHIDISKDGEYIAYTIDTQIHLINKSGQQLFSSDDSVIYQHPVFSIDGQSMYYSMLHQDSWRIEMRNLTQFDTPINLTEGYMAKPCPLPDLGCLYILRDKDESVYRLEKGKLSATKMNVGIIRYPNQIQFTEDSVYYVKRINGELSLMKHHIVTQELEMLTKMPSRYLSLDIKNNTFYTTTMHSSDTMLEQVSTSTAQ